MAADSPTSCGSVSGRRWTLQDSGQLKAASREVHSLVLDGDEARYAMAFVGYLLGPRTSRPGPGHYLGRTWSANGRAAVRRVAGRLSRAPAPRIPRDRWRSCPTTVTSSDLLDP